MYKIVSISNESYRELSVVGYSTVTSPLLRDSQNRSFIVPRVKKSNLLILEKGDSLFSYESTWLGAKAKDIFYLQHLEAQQIHGYYHKIHESQIIPVLATIGFTIFGGITAIFNPTIDVPYLPLHPGWCMAIIGVGALVIEFNSVMDTIAEEEYVEAAKKKFDTDPANRIDS